MHFHNLRRMSDGEPSIGAAEFLAGRRQFIFLPDENDADIQFLRGLHSAFNDRGRPVVSTHRIDGNLHTRLIVQG